MSIWNLPALVKGRHVRDDFQLPPEEYKNRIEKFTHILKDNGLDGCIFYSDSLSNGYAGYFTGYNCVITWSNVMLILEKTGKAHIIAAIPGRDKERLGTFLHEDVETDLVGLSLIANDHVGDKAIEYIQKAGVPGSKWGGVNLKNSPRVSESAINTALGEVKDLSEEFEKLRSEKTERELSIISQAAALAKRGAIELARKCFAGNYENIAAADVDRLIRYSGAEEARILLGASSTGGWRRFPAETQFVIGDTVKIFVQVQYLRYQAVYGLTAKVGADGGVALEQEALDFEAIADKAVTMHGIGMDLIEGGNVNKTELKEKNVVCAVYEPAGLDVFSADTFVLKEGKLLSLSGS